ncbi:MAG: hypothetical protein V4724_30785 [Pseudomonadota bacterium]
MKKTIVLSAALLLGACSNNPPVPDWQMNAHGELERAETAYLSGKDSVEKAEFARARADIASTGQVGLVIRAELARCALRVAALVFEECAGFEALRQDATPADIAYAAYLNGNARAQDTALLPEQHKAVAAAGTDVAAATAMQAIADPLSRLVAAGALFRASRATPAVLATATDTASAQGWRRALLAWLNVQALRAEQAGDIQEAARLRRRIALATP